MASSGPSEATSVSTADRFRLLFVCTANRCRSPMAEAIAADLLARRGVDARVESCGMFESGAPVSPGSVKAIARRGVDLRDHLSRQMDADMLRDADLIVTMERRHLLAIAEHDLEVVRRSFTLVELADLADRVGPRPGDQSVTEWIATADRHRLSTSVLAAGTDDDVADPMGQSRRAYRRTAEQIEGLLQRVLNPMFPDGGATEV